VIPQPPDAIRTARGLTDALNGMETRLGEALESDRKASEDRDAAQARYSKTTRILLLVAAVGLLLDITATTVAFVALNAERHNAATVAELRQVIAEVHQSTISSCTLGNKRAVKERAALDGILAAASAPKSAPLAEREASAAFEAKTQGLVAGGWASRDCATIYKLP
jgi:hypothetical protein